MRRWKEERKLPNMLKKDPVNWWWTLSHEPDELKTGAALTGKRRKGGTGESVRITSDEMLEGGKR